MTHMEKAREQVKKEGKERVVSGMKPSGRPHLGNYFGMMESVVNMQDSYDVFLFVADYHAMNTIHNPEELRRLSYELVLDYLAVGINPEKTVFYLQSSLPELGELTWFFHNLITVPWLERAHAYKDAREKGKEPSMALFDYPVLMAADILITQADLVPVGKDQIQHVEMTREIARKFNARYGETFREPQELVREETGRIPGIDGRKMSKSYGNIIPLFAPEAEIEKAVKRIVTNSLRPEDPKEPESCTIFQLHKLVTPPEELQEIREAYEKGGMGYGESKERLFRNLMNYFAEMRERRRFYEEHPEEVEEILQRGREKIREHALPFLEEIREKVGLLRV